MKTNLQLEREEELEAMEYIKEAVLSAMAESEGLLDWSEKYISYPCPEVYGVYESSILWKILEHAFRQTVEGKADKATPVSIMDWHFKTNTIRFFGVREDNSKMREAFTPKELGLAFEDFKTIGYGELFIVAEHGRMKTQLKWDIAGHKQKMERLTAGLTEKSDREKLKDAVVSSIRRG